DLQVVIVESGEGREVGIGWSTSLPGHGNSLVGEVPRLIYRDAEIGERRGRPEDVAALYGHRRTGQWQGGIGPPAAPHPCRSRGPTTHQSREVDERHQAEDQKRWPESPGPRPGSVRPGGHFFSTLT